MRFYEFAPVRYMQTPAVSNVPAEPVTQVRNIPVVAEPVKRQRVQQLKAAEIARSANQVQPTQHDLEIAMFLYGQAQSQANKDYEEQLQQQKLKQRKNRES